MGGGFVRCYPRLSLRKPFPGVIQAVALLLTAGACTGTAGTYFAPTAAVVNGQKISETDVVRRFRQILADPQQAAQFQGQNAKALRREAEREILFRLVRSRVMASEAARGGIEVQPGEVDERLAALKARFPTEEQFLAQVSRERLTVAEIAHFLEDQILTEKVFAEVTKDVRVPDQAIAQYYERNSQQFADQFHPAHILVCAQFDAAARRCTHTPEDESLAADLSARARQGADFAALANEFSKDANNARRGGDLGWVSTGDVVPEFEQAALALEPGQVADPVRTPFGFHVIKLVAKGRGLAEAREEIDEVLAEEPRQQAFDRWLRRAFDGSTIRVNPKYGRFDKSGPAIVPTDTGLDDRSDPSSP